MWLRSPPSDSPGLVIVKFFLWLSLTSVLFEKSCNFKKGKKRGKLRFPVPSIWVRISSGAHVTSYKVSSYFVTGYKFLIYFQSIWKTKQTCLFGRFVLFKPNLECEPEKESSNFFLNGLVLGLSERKIPPRHKMYRPKIGRCLVLKAKLNSKCYK